MIDHFGSSSGRVGHGIDVFPRPNFVGVAPSDYFAWRNVCVAGASNCGDKVIGLALGNDWRSASAMLEFLRLGLRVAALAPDGSEEEAALRGCEIFFSFHRGDARFKNIRPLRYSAVKGPSIQLATSGTTGAPKVVERELDSWVQEATRYTRRLGLGPDEHVLFSAPIAHAYALGFFWGAVLGGAEIELISPTALGHAAKSVQEKATVLVTTPTLARLMSMRQRDPVLPKRMKYAMAGAGPVDEELDARFFASFGINLSRNYGSTETGAVACGLAPLPPLCVGSLFEGLVGQIRNGTGEVSASGSGALEVTLEDGGVHSFGDEVCLEPGGRLTILGRRTKGARKGEKWIPTLEIENVLFSAPGVSDANVRAVPGRTGSEDIILARIVPSGEVCGGNLVEEVRYHCRDHLPAAMQPQVIDVVRSIPRGPSGKALRPLSWRLAAPPTLAEIARAYKRSALLFSLLDCGILNVLASGELDTEVIAARAKLNPESVAAALQIASMCGIVEQVGKPFVKSDALGSEDVHNEGFDNSLVKLERVLYDTYSNPGAGADVLRHGMLQRPYESDIELPRSLRGAYGDALEGPSREQFRRFGLRGLRQGSGKRVLELGASPGKYISSVMTSAGPSASGVLCQIGRLAPEPCSEARALISAGRLRLESSLGELEDGEFDTIIIDNGVHGGRVPNDLGKVVGLLASEGRILIDDIFLVDGEFAGVGFDWFTHGGVEYPTYEALIKKLNELDLVVTPLGKGFVQSFRRVVLAERLRPELIGIQS